MEKIKDNRTVVSPGLTWLRWQGWPGTETVLCSSQRGLRRRWQAGRGGNASAGKITEIVNHTVQTRCITFDPDGVCLTQQQQQHSRIFSLEDVIAVANTGSILQNGRI